MQSDVKSISVCRIESCNVPKVGYIVQRLIIPRSQISTALAACTFFLHLQFVFTHLWRTNTQRQRRKPNETKATEGTSVHFYEQCSKLIQHSQHRVHGNAISKTATATSAAATSTAATTTPPPTCHTYGDIFHMSPLHLVWN